MHCYEMSPIDWGWEHLKTVKETLLEIIESNPDIYIKTEIGFDSSKAKNLFSALKIN